MQGLLLTADLYNCRCAPAWLLDANQLGDWCAAAVQALGLQAVSQLFHPMAASAQGPGGIAAMVLLADAHVCVHTWPGQKAVTLDVYVGHVGGEHDPAARAQALMQALIDRFEPEWTEQRSLDRGEAA